MFETDGLFHCFWGGFSKQASRPEGPSILAPDFFLHQAQPWYVYENYRALTRDGFLSFFHTEASPQKPMVWETSKFEDFESHFLRIQGWIQCGDLEKCVPFVFAKGTSKVSQAKIVSHCLTFAAKKSGGYSFGLWNKEELILGRTPELLLSQKLGLNWESMALAGTCSWEAYSADSQSFLEDPKESAEQGLVVRYLSEVLGLMGRVHIQPRRVMKAGKLAHLWTPIELQADLPVVLMEALRQVHPTPALGCYPKEGWEDRLKTFGWRGRYGAPFGLSLSSSEAQVIVAIRNIQKKGDGYLLGTGCGVVAESDLQKEWQELDLKQSAVLGLLGL